MSKKVSIAGKEYDSRAVIQSAQRLKLQNDPRVSALAIPNRNANGVTIKLQIPFGKLLQDVKDVKLQSPTPKRIDAINTVVNYLKSLPTYHRK